MSFDAIQLKSIETVMDACMEQIRPPKEMRHELDLGWRLDNQSIVVLETRPNWRDPEIVQEMFLAKATWVKRQKEWHIYWMRGNGKWVRYEPLESVVNLVRFCIELETDPHHCFFG